MSMARDGNYDDSLMCSQQCIKVGEDRRGSKEDVSEFSELTTKIREIRCTGLALE
jgi:hypothetical protein